MWNKIGLSRIVGVASILAAIPIQAWVVDQVLPVKPNLAALLASYLITVAYLVGDQLVRRYKKWRRKRAEWREKNRNP